MTNLLIPKAEGRIAHCSWFRSTFKTPSRNDYPLYLRVFPNADSLVFIDGKSAGAFNSNHKKIKINADGNSLRKAKIIRGLYEALTDI